MCDLVAFICGAFPDCKKFLFSSFKLVNRAENLELLDHIC